MGPITVAVGRVGTRKGNWIAICAHCTRHACSTMDEKPFRLANTAHLCTVDVTCVYVAVAQATGAARSGLQGADGITLHRSLQADVGAQR